MSTNAFIGIRENNSITYIYNHSDGYLEYLGRMLLEYYNSEEKAKALVELGDVSVVKEKLAPAEGTVHGFDYDKRQEGVSVFYGRDSWKKSLLNSKTKKINKKHSKMSVF